MSTDLNAKYQKLATEYAKLRAQVPVLKKAVIDEKEKEKALQDSVKEKDTSIRKYKQEVESLAFRNQQLTSRVQNLQQEFDAIHHLKKDRKANKVKDDIPVISPTNVISEELHSKIQENAMLHSKVQEVDELHRNHMQEMQAKLSQLQAESSQHQSVLDSKTLQSEQRIEQLQRDKVVLEVKFQKQEKELKDAKEKLECVLVEQNNIREDFVMNLKLARDTVADKIKFNDSKNVKLNSFNVPLYNKDHQLKSFELVDKSGELLKELIHGLSNFYTYCEQRSCAYPIDQEKELLSAANKKFCQLLKDHTLYLSPIEGAFKCFQENQKEENLSSLETTTELQKFSLTLQKFVSYFSKLVPLHCISLEEESAVSSCPQSLMMKNFEVCDTLKAVHASLNNVQIYVTLLAKQSLPFNGTPKYNQMKMFELLFLAIHKLHNSVKALSKHFNAKVSLEHQLPTATQKLKTSDECVVSSLISIVTCTGKLATFLSSYIEFLSEVTNGVNIYNTSKNHGCHPSVRCLRKHAVGYMSSLGQEPCSQSVPYIIAAQNRKILFSSTESRESLSQQVGEFHDRLSRLEQEKEHWMLEAQLLQMKYEKQQQECARIIEEMQKRNVAIHEFKNMPVPTTAKFQLGTVSLGEGIQTNQSREELIKNHYSSRIAELTTQVQLADSKAVHYLAECRALHRRLDIAEKQKEKNCDEYNEANQHVAQLKDELQTTTRSYEDQLSMMSEHLAGMNEKLTMQNEQIDMLKFQIKAKGSKKGLLK